MIIISLRPKPSDGSKIVSAKTKTKILRLKTKTVTLKTKTKTVNQQTKTCVSKIVCVPFVVYKNTIHSNTLRYSKVKMLSNNKFLIAILTWKKNAKFQAKKQVLLICTPDTFCNYRDA